MMRSEPSIEQLILDWLKLHAKADDIVCHATTGRPVKAVYRTINGGVPRKYVVEAYFDDYAIIDPDY